MARISQLYDTINKISIASIITPKDICERRHAYELFLNLLPKGLVLLDRGYPAFWLFKAITTMQADFCARMSTKWKLVRQFIASGRKDMVITINGSTAATRKCRALGLNTEPVVIRLVRVKLKSGEIEALATSLTDSKKYSPYIFRQLYHKRWSVEEDFKAIKCWLQLENFTGRSVLSIYQDFMRKYSRKNLVLRV